jgi:hypothetical protein
MKGTSTVHEVTRVLKYHTCFIYFSAIGRSDKDRLIYATAAQHNIPKNVPEIIKNNKSIRVGISE